MSGLKWISWESHRRTDGICDYFSIKPHVVKCEAKSIRRYLCLIYKTLKILRERDTRVLIVQNPSIILTTFSLFVRIFYKYKLIVDAHNEAVQPYVHDNFLVRFVSAKLMKYADLTIVTNSYLAEVVSANGGEPFILPDKIPVVGESSAISLSTNTLNIVFIATYAADEPIAEVIDAAGKLQEKITLYVTGDFTKLAESYRKQLPSNIIFTGYLSNEDYWGYLKAADAVVDLTSMDNCLVCGAYETVAVAKPLILSKNKASIEYFNQGVLFTDNTLEDMHRVFLSLIEEHTKLVREIEKLGKKLPVDWQKKADTLMEGLCHR